MDARRLTVTTFLPFLLIVSPLAPARASLLFFDDPVFGAGAITRDTEAALEWLDVSLSVDRSLEDVSAQFGPGGDFAGFRYATAAEVSVFFVHAGLPLGTVPPNTFPVIAFAELVGPVRIDDGHPSVVGVTGTLDASGGAYEGAAVFFNNGFYGIGVGGFGIGATTSGPDFGSWLVRPGIPEPSTVVLFGTGLAAMTIRARRRFLA